MRKMRHGGMELQQPKKEFGTACWLLITCFGVAIAKGSDHLKPQPQQNSRRDGNQPCWSQKNSHFLQPCCGVFPYRPPLDKDDCFQPQPRSIVTASPHMVWVGTIRPKGHPPGSPSLRKLGGTLSTCTLTLMVYQRSWQNISVGRTAYFANGTPLVS